jgi:anaerobic sulfite reductase subunit B
LRTAAILEAWDETPALRTLRLGVGEAAASHMHAGQYVILRCEAGNGLFALASRPGSAAFDLLLRRGSDVADALCALLPGAEVQVSDAQGAGYPLDRARGADLLLVAAGSGIAPIRSAALEVLARPHDFGRVAVFYGEKMPEDLAYAREMTSWELGGVVVHRVLSRARGSWPGPHGRVQDALRDAPLDPGRTHAFVAGMAPMIEEVTQVLVARGLPAEHVHRNA